MSAPVFKIAAESQLICLKPSCRGAAVSVKLRVCDECGERDITRETGTEHCMMTYLIEEKIICDAPLEPALDRRGCRSIKT